MSAEQPPLERLERERAELLAERERLCSSVGEMHPRVAARAARALADRLDSLAARYAEQREQPRIEGHDHER